MKSTAPFGSWKSPVTPEFVSGKDRALTQAIQVDGKSVYFLESRPDEGGRQTLIRLGADGQTTEVLPKEFNVRTKYLEYGGLSFLVTDGVVYFVNFADQEIWAAAEGQAPVKLTQSGGERFADLQMDRKRNRLLALREVPGRPESRNSICAIDLKTGQIQDLVTGADFYNCARLKGDKLLWISWNHPNMPWNGTELFTADLSDLKNPIKIAGDREHAISQARWSPDDDDIYFVGEFTDFARLHRHRAGRIEVVFDIPAEFGLPDWVPGQQLYDFVGSAVVAAHAVNGRWQMVIRDGNGQPRRLGPTYALIGAIRAQGARIVAMVTHSDKPATLIAVSQAGEIESLFEGTAARLDSGYLSIGEELRYPVENGGEGYAWFYPPKNAEFEGPKTERPPLVVMAHGGPTAMSFASYNKSIQFWTSRGFAVVDVNYGGSTGYGRKYRERLRDNWGVVDVGDCAAAVRTLGARGLIDPKRVAIRGGSAGGYTTLAALAFTKDVFAVGASYYGVSDLELLAKETHKFESRYLDQLVGPYPSAIQVYRERAPRAHIEKFDCPIVFFQGGEDKVVLPNQAELMYESLKVKGITTEYHLYPKEGHGFVDAKNVQHSLKTELAFYAKVFGVNGFELDAKRV